MPDENYTIRPATADDADAVTAMWAEMAAEHEEYDPQRWEWAPDAAEKQRQHFLETVADAENGVVLVAVDLTGSVVGYLLAGITAPAPVWATSRRGQIYDLFVMPAHRREGIGRRLAEAGLEVLKARGAEDVALRVATSNTAAIRLYEKLGMRVAVQEMYKRL